MRRREVRHYEPASYPQLTLPAGDPGGPELKRRAKLPVYVDEDCHTLADVADHRLTISAGRVDDVARVGDAFELRTRDRQRKLIAKIDAALRRLEDGSYGFCEETGEPIGLKRLEARPIATLSIEAQERHERMEKVHRDD